MKTSEKVNHLRMSRRLFVISMEMNVLSTVNYFVDYFLKSQQGHSILQPFPKIHSQRKVLKDPRTAAKFCVA